MRNILLTSLTFILLTSFCQAQVVNICYDEKDGALLKDFSDCTKYYACVNQVGYIQSCPSGYEFDPKLESCVYPSTTTCTTCPAAGTSPSLTFLPVPQTCDKYVICTGGKPFLQACVGGLQFNGETGKCDLASNVNCVGPAATCQPSTNGLLTFIKGSGCTQYTICYNGQGFAQSCAAGTVFNPNIDACVPSSQYTCPAASTTSSRNLPRALASSARDHPEITHELIHRPKIGCPTVGTKFLPDAESCSRYVFCIMGQSAMMSCAKGLHFDRKTETCRLPAEAHCKLNK